MFNLNVCRQNIVETKKKLKSTNNNIKQTKTKTKPHPKKKHMQVNEYIINRRAPLANV